jgi:hypothetical protein
MIEIFFLHLINFNRFKIELIVNKSDIKVTLKIILYNNIDDINLFFINSST